MTIHSLQSIVTVQKTHLLTQIIFALQVLSQMVIVVLNKNKSNHNAYMRRRKHFQEYRTKILREIFDRDINNAWLICEPS